MVYKLREPSTTCFSSGGEGGDYDVEVVGGIYCVFCICVGD